MKQRTSATTAIEGTTPTLRFLATDALRVPEGAPLDRFRRFTRWRLQDWTGTVLAYQDIRLQELTDITIGLSEPITPYYHRWSGLLDRMVSITDAHNAVVDVPTTEALQRKRRIYRQADASTAADEYGESSSTIIQRELMRHVEDAVTHVFGSAEDQNFEDGMESDFSRELLSLLRRYGDIAMSEICYLIICDRVAEEVASEALRWLARIDDASTYGWRLWLLEKSLSSKSPVVRDGAALGLVSMCDPQSIQYMKEAIEQETIPELRSDLQGALRELEAFLDVLPITGNQQA